jgi:hypothetical protein
MSVPGYSVLHVGSHCHFRDLPAEHRQKEPLRMMGGDSRIVGHPYPSPLNRGTFGRTLEVTEGRCGQLVMGSGGKTKESISVSASSSAIPGLTHASFRQWPLAGLRRLARGPLGS